MGEKKMAATLRAVLATVDHLPQAALRAANAAIRWRDLDADLAQLTADPGLNSPTCAAGSPSP